MTTEQQILVGGALLAAGLGASLLADRIRLPGLVLFLGIGMIAGSDVTGWIAFDNMQLAQSIGIIALAVILFEGGLSAGWREIRPVLAPALGLAVVGTVATAAVCGLAAKELFGLTLLEGLLLGAILSSTDGAAIFALLRGSTLRRRLARTLEGESGFNDPVAVLLVLGFVDWITEPHYGLADMLWLMVHETAIGVAVGLVVGRLGVAAFRSVRLSSAGLYPAASLSMAAIAFGGAATLEGSGFLAVYLAGLELGSADVPARRTVSAFHQGLSWVAQVALFVTLGLLVFPSALGDVAIRGTVLALVLVLVARPLAAALATLPFRFSAPERAILGWAGLRGGVPVVLATYPVLAGVPHSDEFFNIVFFAVVLSTVVQGATVESLARRLGVTTSRPALPPPLTESGTVRALGAEVLEFPVGDGDAIVGARVRDLGLPREAVVNVIVRGDAAIPPRGSTRIQAGDELHVLLRSASSRRVHALLERWRSGPVGRPPRPVIVPTSTAPVFTTWPWDTAREGDPAAPDRVRGLEVIDQLRVRRDEPGGLFVLADGRYALTGRLAAVGSRRRLSDATRVRLRKAADPDERAWLRTVIAALAGDAAE